MATIVKIVEFTEGYSHKANIAVFFASNRKFNYSDRDTLPMGVVDFLTADDTISETVYIKDDWNKCINKRTTYTK